MLPKEECTGKGGGNFTGEGGGDFGTALVAETPCPASATATESEDKTLRQRAADAIARTKVALEKLVSSGSMPQAEADAIIQSCIDAAKAV
jgi:hypothetical protein